MNFISSLPQYTVLALGKKLRDLKQPLSKPNILIKVVPSLCMVGQLHKLNKIFSVTRENAIVNTIFPGLMVKKLG